MRTLALVLSVACAAGGIGLIASAHWSALGRPGNTLMRVVLPGPFANRSLFTAREWTMRWLGAVLVVAGASGIGALVVLAP